MIQWLLAALFIIVQLSDHASSSCSQRNMELESKKIYTITSPRYPSPYWIAICLYSGTAPADHRVTLYCDDFDILETRTCLVANFNFSPTGDTGFVDGQRYCGKKDKLTLETTGNHFAARFINFIINFNSQPGFRCYVQAIPLSEEKQPEPPTPATTVAPSATTAVTPATTAGPPAPTDATPATTTAASSCSCGMKKAGTKSLHKIIGGRESDVNEFPWMAALMEGGSQFCGGALISEYWVLTASHCVDGSSASGLRVILGEHSVNVRTSGPAEEFDVEEIIMHAEYDDTTVDNDIALLKLKYPVTFTDTISPVCLPYNIKDSELLGKIVTATGWGLTSTGWFSQPSDTLLEVDLPVLSTSACRQFADMTHSLTENMICTYMVDKDTCQGDSGGPLTYETNGRQYQVGIVSWGFGCAEKDKPGVYTKLNNYLDWIDQKVGNTLCHA